MNIISLIDENISITFDYYNTSKSLYEEILNYMKLYKTHTSQYCQKMSSLNLDFENKLLTYKNESNKNIDTSHIFQYIKIFPELIKKKIFNYLPLFDNIDIFIKEFEDLVTQKKLLLKNQQDKYNESKKNLIKKFQEIDNFKNLYLTNISQTEDTINEYFTQKKKITEYKENPNKKNQININFEQNKKSEEKMNTLIKETKTIENNYISSIESSKNLQSIYKEVSNQIIQMVKESLYDMSNKYKTSLFGILGLFKVPFQVTLNNLIKNIETIIKSKEKEIIDNLLDNLYNKNVSTLNIFPNKYKLKAINLLNTNNDNIFSMSFFDEDNTEKENDKKDEMSEISLSLIKLMYQNFNLLSSHKIDIKIEEEKLLTSNLSKKLFKNVENFNNSNKNPINKDLLFTENDSTKLETLIDKKYNVLIFLQKLNSFRTLNKFQLGINHYIIIGKILYKLLSKFEEDNDFNIPRNCIILSQTYYYLHLNQKIYLKTYIEEHKIFKDISFWENIVNFLINKEMKNKEDYSTYRQLNVAFGILYTFSDILFEFNLNEEDIRKIIDSKMKQYNLDEKSINDINKLIDIKIENRKNKESEEKKISIILKEIIDDCNNNIILQKNEQTKTEENKEKKTEKDNKNNNNKKENSKNEKNNIWEIDDD